MSLKGDVITIEEPKPTQVQIKGINLRDILDDGFLGAMEKAMGKNPYYSGLQIIYKDNEGNNEMINMFHGNKEQSEQNILYIDAQNPETLAKVVKTVIKYYEGCADA